MHTGVHFCYKIVYCGIWDWCIARYWTGTLWDCELSLLLHAHKIRVAATHPLPCFNGRLAKINIWDINKYTCAVFNYQLRYGSQLHNNRLTGINKWLLTEGKDRSQMMEVTHLFPPVWTTLTRSPYETPSTKRSHAIILWNTKTSHVFARAYGCTCMCICVDHVKIWSDERLYFITLYHQFPNVNGCTVEVWECISNFTPHCMLDVITYSWWN